MAYTLRRVEPREGVGPLVVYRAVNTANPPLHQTPQKWLRSMPWFQQLETDPTPARALAVYTPPGPGQVSFVPKAWTELAYEHTRTKIRPTAPSRLSGLFAMLDALEALSFTEETGNGQAVFEGTVENGAPWAVVDMSRFGIQQPAAWSVEGLADAWGRACAAAEAYWRADAPINTAEVLVEGAIDLRPERLLLVPTLRRLGLVE